MVVKREQYVDNLVGSMHNGLIKVVTGLAGFEHLCKKHSEQAPFGHWAYRNTTQDVRQCIFSPE